MGFLVSSATTENNVNGGGEWSKVVELLKFNFEYLLCWKVKRAGLWFFNFFPFLYLLFWLCLSVFLVLCLNSSGAAEERRWKIMIFWCKCGISLNILFNCKRWQQIMYIYDIYFQNIVWKWYLPYNLRRSIWIKKIYYLNKIKYVICKTTWKSLRKHLNSYRSSP